jgi:protein tyrosine phosphatase (PTP) superfamily phosphohydrolase (DUF442 family)
MIILTLFVYRTSVFRPLRNFHVVDPGKFYRGAQPTPDEIRRYQKEFGLKTIINLRGEQKGEWWYDAEKTAVDQLGIRLENIGFSTEHMQAKEDWLKYLDILRTAEKPVFVHCRSGADRTSEASAIYQIEFMQLPKEEALKSLTFQFLHIAGMWPAKTFFVQNFQGYNWVRDVYEPCREPFFQYSSNRCRERIK